MKWFHWLGFMIAAGLLVFGCTMSVHAEEEAGPKWKIMIILDGPPGKQELTYGSQKDGVHWFANRDDCEKARKGDDKKFAEGMVKLKAIMANMKKQGGPPIAITTECRMDDSV